MTMKKNQCLLSSQCTVAATALPADDKTSVLQHTNGRAIQKAHVKPDTALPPTGASEP